VEDAGGEVHACFVSGGVTVDGEFVNGFVKMAGLILGVGGDAGRDIDAGIIGGGCSILVRD
jgi:hypothetical protein